MLSLRGICLMLREIIQDLPDIVADSSESYSKCHGTLSPE